MPKKIVHYDCDHIHGYCIGLSALVKTLDHPDSDNVSNKKFVITSTVVAVHENGVFETLNTIYKPTRIS
jgi:hypothetical protein